VELENCKVTNCRSAAPILCSLYLSCVMNSNFIQFSVFSASLKCSEFCRDIVLIVNCTPHCSAGGDVISHGWNSGAFLWELFGGAANLWGSCSLWNTRANGRLDIVSRSGLVP